MVGVSGLNFIQYTDSVLFWWTGGIKFRGLCAMRNSWWYSWWILLHVGWCIVLTECSNMLFQQIVRGVCMYAAILYCCEVPEAAWFKLSSVRIYCQISMHRFEYQFVSDVGLSASPWVVCYTISGMVAQWVGIRVAMMRSQVWFPILVHWVRTRAGCSQSWAFHQIVCNCEGKQVCHLTGLSHGFTSVEF